MPNLCSSAKPDKLPIPNPTGNPNPYLSATPTAALHTQDHLWAIMALEKAKHFFIWALNSMGTLAARWLLRPIAFRYLHNNMGPVSICVPDPK